MDLKKNTVTGVEEGGGGYLIGDPIKRGARRTRNGDEVWYQQRGKEKQNFPFIASKNGWGSQVEVREDVAPDSRRFLTKRRNLVKV